MSDAANLIMRRNRLDDLPILSLPPGVSLLPFDEQHGPAAWEHIVNTAFGRNFTFDSRMRVEEAFRPERICLLAVDGTAAAVAAAWQRGEYPPGTGYLHYVAVLPEFQGRRLGYWVSLAALHQMRREGNTRAVLKTQDFRLPAIKTYLRLGFVPVTEGDESYIERWRVITSKITHYELRITN